MKKIAITQRLVEDDTYVETREALDIKYSKLIYNCGFLPIILPYEVEFEKYFNEIDIDGVLLTGGNDLFSCSQSKISQTRDNYEKELLEYSMENDIPVFGICRGMQLIAEYFGSSFKKVENQVNIKHKLKINNKSKYALYLKKITQVNSYHNFGIEKLSDYLIVSAISEDKIIKAIEHKKYKIFAQMWHSEREKPFKNSELNLIKGFFA